MNLKYCFDIIVAGGGPSGLFAAKLLSEKGYSVALFDKELSIGDNVVCSGVISKEAFRNYDLPSHAIVGKLQNAVLNSPSNDKIEYRHPSEDVVVVNRKKFDSELGRRAEMAGVRFFSNSKVISIDTDENIAEVKIRCGDEIKTYRSRLVIIATGVSFNLQQSLGLGRPKIILKGIQTEIKAPEIKRLNMFWGNNYSKGFFSWAIPLANGNVKIGVMTREDPVECFRYTLRELGKEKLLETGELELKRRGISFGPINKNYSRRVIVVGEAAGLVKTTTGGGIYYGLISADIASNIIDKAFQMERFDEKFLSVYQKQVNSRFSREIKLGEYFHRFYSDLDDQHINKLFYAAKEDNLLDFIANNGSFDWHKNAILRIFRSPNFRNVLFRELVRKTSGKLALNS